jgi:hypothetical protein
MFGKWGTLAALLFCVSCAKPEYAPERNLAPNNEAEQQADCSLKFNQSHYCIAWKWEKTPDENNTGSLLFKVYRKNLGDGSAVLLDIQDSVNVVLWMPDMNHGSSPVEVARLDVGTYRASEVYFVMPGTWEIKFQIKDSKGLIDEAVATIHY